MVDLEEATTPASATRSDRRAPSRLAREEFMKLPQSVRNLVAGGVAGMAAKTVVAPIDRIKILYQVSSARFRVVDVPKVAVNIVQTEGMAALWKGNTATMIRVFPYAGIQFMVFDSCKSYLLRRKPIEPRIPGDNPKSWGLTALESLVAGSIAGAASVVATYPLDLTRAQLAVIQKKRGQKSIGFPGLIAKLYRANGLRGLFRGITPTLLGILPYSGVAFALNDQGKKQIQIVTGKEPSTVDKMICGALAGLVAQTLTYPLEVTRRRMQTLGVVNSKDSATQSLGVGAKGSKGGSSMMVIMRQLYQEQGIYGFFKGVSMNWIKGPVAFSISFTTYDMMQDFFLTDLEQQLRRKQVRR